MNREYVQYKLLHKYVHVCTYLQQKFAAIAATHAGCMLQDNALLEALPQHLGLGLEDSLKGMPKIKRSRFSAPGILYTE